MTVGNLEMSVSPQDGGMDHERGHRDIRDSALQERLLSEEQSPMKVRMNFPEFLGKRDEAED